MVPIAPCNSIESNGYSLYYKGDDTFVKNRQLYLANIGHGQRDYTGQVISHFPANLVTWQSMFAILTVNPIYAQKASRIRRRAERQLANLSFDYLSANGYVLCMHVCRFYYVFLCRDEPKGFVLYEHASHLSSRKAAVLFVAMAGNDVHKVVDWIHTLRVRASLDLHSLPTGAEAVAYSERCARVWGRISHSIARELVAVLSMPEIRNIVRATRLKGMCQA